MYKETAHFYQGIKMFTKIYVHSRFVADFARHPEELCAIFTRIARHACAIITSIARHACAIFTSIFVFASFSSFLEGWGFVLAQLSLVVLVVLRGGVVLV